MAPLRRDHAFPSGTTRRPTCPLPRSPPASLRVPLLETINQRHLTLQLTKNSNPNHEQRDLAALRRQHRRSGSPEAMAKSGAGAEEWRRNADTHKMSAEEVRAAGVEASMRPPGRGSGAGPGEVLHQRGRLPYGPGTMALIGFGIFGVVGYLVLYQKARPGTPAAEVAKVAVGHGDPAAGRDADKRPEPARQGN
ncbi:hypothetical protein ACP4OV_031177 [Aristida adscensionis]